MCRLTINILPHAETVRDLKQKISMQSGTNVCQQSLYSLTGEDELYNDSCLESVDFEGGLTLSLRAGACAQHSLVTNHPC
jgi:hypothetical protein